MILPFSWGLSWSLPPVQCHKPLSIVLQALCLSDLIPWIPMTLPPTNEKNFYELIIPSSLNHYYKTLHYPLQVCFEGITLLRSPFPGKAMKLFFASSPKNLSLRVNLVSGFSGQIQLEKRGNCIFMSWESHSRETSSESPNGGVVGSVSIRKLTLKDTSCPIHWLNKIKLWGDDWWNKELNEPFTS